MNGFLSDGDLSNEYYRMALFNAKHNNLSRAAELAQNAICLNPDDGRPRRLLGLCLYEMGDMDGAEKALSAFPELYEQVADEHKLARAEIENIRSLMAEKKTRKAEARARKIRHKSVRVLNIRACILAASKRYKKAARIFARALNKDNGDKTALSGIMATCVKRR